MDFSVKIKNQLTDFVDCYRKYFWRTLETVLIYTVICFSVIALLLEFSDFDVANGKKQVSILSYFFTRFSSKEVYSLVDLAKTVFIFFVALFSLGLTRQIKNEINDEKKLSFRTLTKRFQIRHIMSLFGILILCSGIDFSLFRFDSLTENKMDNHEFQKWVHSILFLMRIYVPLILFSITLYKLTSQKPLKLTLGKVILLFISLWFFNEFAYEVSLFVRAHVFGLLLLPFDEDKKYLYESFLGIMLIAFYFVGYHSAMTTPLKHEEAELERIVQ